MSKAMQVYLRVGTRSYLRSRAATVVSHRQSEAQSTPWRAERKKGTCKPYEYEVYAHTKPYRQYLFARAGQLPGLCASLGPVCSKLPSFLAFLSRLATISDKQGGHGSIKCKPGYRYRAINTFKFKPMFRISFVEAQ